MLPVACFHPPQMVLPPSDIDLMKAELAIIDKQLNTISNEKSTPETYEILNASLEALNSIILSVDNSNDFFKIGGFSRLVPLLHCSNSDVVAATAEMIADLCQNNTFCQDKALELNLLPELVMLLDKPPNSKECSKGIYAISCLCRNHKESIKCLKETNVLPSLMRILKHSDEKLRAKTAFFISQLSNCDIFRDDLYEANVIGSLVDLLKGEDNSSTEHLLCALRTLVYKHVQSRVECSRKENGLKEILLSKKGFYESKEEYEEAMEHCDKILALCFPEDKLENLE